MSSIKPSEVVLSFSSHRSRDRSGVHNDPRCHAVYSFRRASKGGYYRMPADISESYTYHESWSYEGCVRILRYEKTKGVCVLRAPYDDIGDCWG